MAIPGQVAVTPLHLVELMAIRKFDALVDARMQKYRVSSDLRGIAEVPLVSVPTLNPVSIATSQLKRIRPSQASSLKAERPVRLTASRALSARSGESASFILSSTDRGVRR